MDGRGRGAHRGRPDLQHLPPGLGGQRLGRGELTDDDCPAEVREVLELGRVAEHQSAGAFSVHLPTPDGTRRLDPSGVVKGWAVQRASGC